jgi:tetratricopeptide (TPR) repeat protein
MPAALLVAVTALSVGTLLLAQEQRRTEEARREEARQRQFAQENFRQARQAVDDYLTQVSESTLLNSPLPGLQPLRKELLTTALKYYQRFAEQHRDDPELRAELARAHYRLGTIYKELDEREEARKAFREARDLWERLGAEDSGARASPFELARTCTVLGALQTDVLDQQAQGRAQLDKSHTLLEQLVGEEPDNVEFADALATNFTRLGVAVAGGIGERPGVDQEAVGENLGLDLKALAIRERLARTDPRRRKDLASAAMNVGYCYTRLNKATPALRYHTRARDVLEELGREKPHDVWLRRETVRAYINLGYLHQAVLRKYDEALKNYDRALELVEQLARDNPSVPDYQLRK